MKVFDKWLVKLQICADASAGARAFTGQKTRQSSSESRLDVTGGGRWRGALVISHCDSSQGPLNGSPASSLAVLSPCLPSFLLVAAGVS